MTRRSVALILAAAVTLPASPPGVRPRASTADYPAHETTNIASFGASVIPPNEAKRIFAADLDKAGYIVIEVGVFPAAGSEIDLSPLDFTLRTDPNALPERTADDSVIASAAIRPSPGASTEAPAEEVSITSGASVEHISYPDPVTGKKDSATIVGVNSGAGVSRPCAPQPGANGANPDRLEQQLWEKSLPDGKTSAPVAGYLYFPKPSKKKKNAAWILELENASGRVNLTLPNSAK